MRRGFTLIELMVSIVLAIIVTGVAIEVLLVIGRSQKEIAERAQLSRDAQLVTDLLTHDLSFLGVGVPRGLRKAPANFTAPIVEHQLRPPIRVGEPDSIAFVGDLPFPNAELTGILKLVDEDDDDDGEIMVASELCPCTPQATTPGNHKCDCTARTLIQGSFAAADNCNASQKTARLCPWKMNKVLTQSDGKAYLLLVDTAGDWHERRWALNDASKTEDDEYGLELSLDAWQPTGNSGESTAAVDVDMALFNGGVGSGYVTQLDRVFWSFESADGTGACPTGAKDCVLRRRQCWGRIVDPGAAAWPKVRDGAIRSTTFTPADCTAGTDGTGWETIMTGMTAFSVRYFIDSANELTGPWTLAQSSQTRLVEISMTLERVAGTQTLTETSTRRVFLRNHGGILNQSLANGGCVKDGC